MKKFISCILAVLLAAVLLPHVVFAQEDKIFEVSDMSQLLAAAEEINAADSGTFGIVLKADIALTNQALVLEKNTTTIYGGGNTLTFASRSSFLIKGSAAVRLGGEGYKESLQLLSTENTMSIFAVSGNAELSMFEHVTLGSSEASAAAGGQPGGVLLNDNAVFHMYGGVITDCNNWASVAGGVFVDDCAAFYMHGGVIKNCSGYQGGGVGVNSGTFIMYGGEIKNCTGVYYGGGGVSVYSYYPAKMAPVFIMEGGSITDCKAKNTGAYGGAVFVYDSKGNAHVELSGGELSGNQAEEYGGGLFLFKGSAEISEEVKIYNNRAEEAGDDIFNYGGAITLKDVPAGLMLDECKHSIDGWYEDGINDRRWGIDSCGAEAYAERYVPGEQAEKNQLALKAAHGELPIPYTVEFYLDGVLKPSATVAGTAKAGTILLYETFLEGQDFEGYVLDKTVPADTVTVTKEGENLLKIYLVTEQVYEYMIHYFVDGMERPELSETGKSQTARLDDVPDKCPDSYHLDAVVYGETMHPQNGNPGSVEIFVYYIKTEDFEEEKPLGDSGYIWLGMALLISGAALTCLARRGKKVKE